jgi:hypothetical protein
MTTIAFDGKTLAADTLGVAGILKRGECKLYMLQGPFAIGCSGVLYRIRHLVNWIDKTAILRGPDPVDWGAWPFHKGDDDDPGAILVSLGANPCGQCWRLEGDIFIQETLPFSACGSGYQFALGAMHSGMTAQEAVGVASVYDCYTGGRIDTIDCTVVR